MVLSPRPVSRPNLHAMGKTPEAFCLVVQKTRVPEKVKPQDSDTPVQMEIAMQEQQLNPVDGESALKDGFIYRALPITHKYRNSKGRRISMKLTVWGSKYFSRFFSLPVLTNRIE